jgi:hypothetical protein
LQQIVDGYFNSGMFAQTVDSIDSLISSYVEVDPTAFYDYDAYKSAITELKELGLLRAESIEGQLNGTIPSTSKGQSADSSMLVDASSVNLSALGSQGGGKGGGADRGPGGMGGMQSDEQIEQFNNMTQGNFGGMGVRPPGNAPVTTSGFDVTAWLLIGGCTILLLAGLWFVVWFKRR